MKFLNAKTLLLPYNERVRCSIHYLLCAPRPELTSFCHASALKFPIFKRSHQLRRCLCTVFSSWPWAPCVRLRILPSHHHGEYVCPLVYTSCS
ncbi:hypothetical protein PILCRDRAFT_252803 [Piloderma croceum F 1598]|uniref:Uncharacterized protein n=1 Tax=Piloderma croceum (strain F 1598) TaxID=765440 RepID=A0A0C3GCA5_PILCF|nr:hypothetical protein PILCRDRAFT_252803 [Piloderma croceum F 1598]